jgi:hypothetical protein
MYAKRRRGRFAGFALAIVCGLGATFGARAAERQRVWHFAANENFDAAGAFLPSSAGFNLADVSSRRELDLLPRGTMGLVWVGLCEGVTARFKAVVGAVINHPKTFGFYLVDDPDPTGRWRAQCKPSDLRAESDWIHRRRPAAITFVALMNLGSSASPSFSADYRPKVSHIDLFGVSPYPCRTGSSECDYDMIDRFVRSSRDAGIPPDRIIPTFQSFGGGEWRTDSGDAYRLPTPSELQVMLERWNKLIPAPVFDYAYSWGSQRSDVSLADSADLKAMFGRHNHGRAGVKLGEARGDSSASVQLEIGRRP